MTLPPDQLWRAAPDTYARHASQHRWKMYKHLTYIATRVRAAVIRGNGRIIINMPPRHGKSELLSYWMPIWFIDNQPHQKVILASYGDELASSFGRRVRNEFENNQCCRARLSEDSKAAGRWNTPQGGGMLVTGVGGPLSGFGGNLMVIDDPCKNWQEANSRQSKIVLNEWYNSTFRTRAEPDATIVVSHTRWTEDDLTGNLIEENEENWEVISLPALALENDPLGRLPGEALCPERYPVPALEATRLAVGGPVWEACYQQNPKAYGVGRLYANYSPANLDPALRLRPDLPLHLTWDFNSNPGMHVEIGQYDNRADVFNVCHEIHGPRMNVVQACQEFKAFLEARGWRQGSHVPWPGPVCIFGDATGETGSVITSQSCYDMIRNMFAGWGIDHQVRHPAGNPAVRDRLDTVNDALCDTDGRRHLKVHPGCARLLDDFKNMKSDVSGLEDKHDHALSHASSAVGYWAVFLRPLCRLPSKMVGGRVGV